jgi:hypothetical protein
MYNSFANATSQNLVKVAATKDADGYVSIPARMQRGSFQALVRTGWLKEEKLPARPGYSETYRRAYTITAKGEEVLVDAAELEANPFVGGHGAKAQETFRLLDTKHSDWFHPAVKWVRETRKMPFDQFKACPTCDGLSWVQKDAEGKVTPPPACPAKGSYDYKAEMARHDYVRAARNAAKGGGYGYSYSGNCETCKQVVRRGYSESTGRVFSHVEWKPVQMMVGYIVWPKGVKHDVSRFQGYVRSNCQCEICGKGINKSGRVPVCHDKAGKVFSMWVGQDCAKKFCKVASIAKPTKDENKKGLPSTLDVNYIVEGE